MARSAIILLSLIKLLYLVGCGTRVHQPGNPDLSSALIQSIPYLCSQRYMGYRGHYGCAILIYAASADLNNYSLRAPSHQRIESADGLQKI